MLESVHLPLSRRDFVFSPMGADGKYVVKDPRRQTYFRLGPRERLLLDLLDGRHERDAICREFREQFNDELTDEDLDGFLELAASRGLLEDRAGTSVADNQQATAPPAAAPTPQVAPAKLKPAGQNILAWRKSLFDPDRLFGLLEPGLRFFWTRTFLTISALMIAAAAAVLWLNRAEFVSDLAANLRWQTLVLGAVALLIVTSLHESAHGLTCKHYGGEVHEVGFLLIFFMPSFFCNVSDAWLLPKKSQRLAITFAGGYFELCLWAVAVFVWRLTLQDTLVNYLAWTVVSVSGVRVLFNFLPFIKLDGYYLLSDALDMPNLRQRGLERTAARLRWLLWGAARPANEPREKTLLVYGAVCWCASLVMLASMLWAMGRQLDRYIGHWGAVIVLAPLALAAGRTIFQGFTKGEASQMVRTRPMRSLFWGASLTGVSAVLGLVKIEQRATGDFCVEPATSMQVRAPLPAFIKEVAGEEGTHVSAGERVALLEVPDLESKIAGKQAELRETEAQLRLLKTGTRQEELDDARERVERAVEWRDLAKADLKRAQAACEKNLARLEQKGVEAVASLKQAIEDVERMSDLYRRRVVSEQQLHEAQTAYKKAKAQLAQVRSEKAAEESVGTLKSEEELARREKELDEAKAALTLLEAGSRQEEIEAAEASLARQKEELAFLEEQKSKLPLFSRVDGVITTPHLKDRVGEYIEQGGLVCEIKESSSLEIEISIPEDRISKVKPGQCVDLKARALPYETFAAEVERIAPAATSGDHQSTVVVYCRLVNESTALKPEMTGHARVYCGKKPIGEIGLDYVLRFIRTEFWW
ncbi:MAG TPA: efflux RND transporter periplasmic adaptor subunit [Pirellulales bacterium]|nr:efflux RND transporter periplasmic adaptor subunit [Pirellulales bacterium]